MSDASLVSRVAVRWILAKKQPDYKDYVEDKKKKGEKPLPKDQWESKVLGKGQDSGGGSVPSSAKKWESVTKKDLPFNRRDPDKKLRFQVPLGMRDPARKLQKSVTEALGKAKGKKPKIDFKSLKSQVDTLDKQLGSWKATGDEAEWKKEMQEFVSSAKSVVKDLKKQHGGLMSKLRRAEDRDIHRDLIRLAKVKPEFRPHLLPLLRKYHRQALRPRNRW